MYTSGHSEWVLHTQDCWCQSQRTKRWETKSPHRQKTQYCSRTLYQQATLHCGDLSDPEDLQSHVVPVYQDRKGSQIVVDMQV
jgi:hypothetical protein